MSIDKNTNEGKNYRNNVVKSTSGTSKSRINTGFPEDISVLSPMMREYCKTKESYKDCILFYRLGDFYEMFFDDAILVSKELELTLTGKDVRNSISCSRDIYQTTDRERPQSGNL